MFLHKDIRDEMTSLKKLDLERKDKKLHNPKELFHHPVYSRAISVANPGQTHFIAGHTSADKNYNPLHAGDIVKQYYEVMRQLEITLNACGAKWDDVVMRRIYVLDMDDFLNKVQTESKQNHFWDVGLYPPSTLIQVGRLSNKHFLIEIDLIACTSK